MRKSELGLPPGHTGRSIFDEDQTPAALPPVKEPAVERGIYANLTEPWRMEEVAMTLGSADPSFRALAIPHVVVLGQHSVAKAQRAINAAGHTFTGAGDHFDALFNKHYQPDRSSAELWVGRLAFISNPTGPHDDGRRLVGYRLSTPQGRAAPGVVSIASEAHTFLQGQLRAAGVNAHDAALGTGTPVLALGYTENQQRLERLAEQLSGRNLAIGSVAVEQPRMYHEFMQPVLGANSY